MIGRDYVFARRKSRTRFGAAIAGVFFLGLATAAEAALTISQDPTTQVACSGGVCTAKAANANLNATDLAAMLAAGDATVASGKKAKDIQIIASFSWTSANKLTLDAYRSIDFEQAVVVSGNGALTLWTADGSKDGDFGFAGKGQIQFWDPTSSLAINGFAHTLVGSVAALASAVAADPSGHFALANDYDAKFDGTYTASPVATTLAGTFEGLGNTISNLSINATALVAYDGLFAEIGTGPDSGAVVRDVGLSNISLTTQSASGSGGIAGHHNGGTILQSHVSGTIAGSGDSGGLVGRIDWGGKVLRSWATATISHGGSHDGVGGLIGSSQLDGVVSQCWASGKVSGGNISNVGGLAGFIQHASTISNSYATGAVTIASDDNGNVGGLVGQVGDQGAVAQSYSTGKVSGLMGTVLGGLIGSVSPSAAFKHAYWDTTTSGIKDKSRGAGNVSNEPGIKARTTSQLQSGLPEGFLPTIWGQDPAINGGLPYLPATPPN